MTDEQIKRIAEEYVNDIVNRMGIPKDFISADVRKGLASDCTAILNWLSTRYCVVERCKVVEMYQQVQSFYEDSKEQYWAGQADFCDDLFGSETFNEKEE